MGYDQKWILDGLGRLLAAGFRIESVDWSTGEVRCFPTVEVEFTRAREGKTDALLGFLRAGKKLDAIKEYRHLYGVGLADAKRAVEEMTLAHGLGFRDAAGHVHFPVKPCHPGDVPEDRTDW